MSKYIVETDIQNDMRVQLSEYGICLRLQAGTFYTKTGTPVKIGIEGLPDLLFVGDDGFVAWLEVKKPGGNRRDGQKKFIKIMHSMGHKAEFVESIEDAKKAIGVDTK